MNIKSVQAAALLAVAKSITDYADAIVPHQTFPRIAALDDHVQAHFRALATHLNQDARTLARWPDTGDDT